MTNKSTNFTGFGFHRFLLRSLRGAKAEAALFFIAYNLMKCIRWAKDALFLLLWSLHFDRNREHFDRKHLQISLKAETFQLLNVLLRRPPSSRHTGMIKNAIYLLCLCCICGCSARAVKESELPGRYISDQPYTREELIVRTNHTYSQKLIVKSNGHRYVRQGKWRYSADEQEVIFDNNIIIVFPMNGKVDETLQWFQKGSPGDESSIPVYRSNGKIHIVQPDPDDTGMSKYIKEP